MNDPVKPTATACPDCSTLKVTETLMVGSSGHLGIGFNSWDESETARAVVRNGALSVESLTFDNDRALTLKADGKGHLMVGGVVSAKQFQGDGAALTNLDAGKITTGMLAVSLIPDLPAGKITSGTLAVSLIPDLPADRITSGTLSVDCIPDLPADRITSGTIAGTMTINGQGNVSIAGALTIVDYSNVDIDVPSPLTHLIRLQISGGFACFTHAADDKKAYTILTTRPHSTSIMGCPSGGNLVFYWVDEGGNYYRSGISGGTLYPPPGSSGNGF